MNIFLEKKILDNYAESYLYIDFGDFSKKNPNIHISFFINYLCPENSSEINIDKW